MTMTVEILKAARDLLAKGWTQGAYARDEIGLTVGENDKRACRFCSVGAIWAAASRLNDGPSEAQSAVERIPRARFLIAWNDDSRRTQADVLALFDEAIANEEARR